MTSVYPNTQSGINPPPLSAQHRHASESASERQVKPAPRHTLLKKAALAYAARGIRVFPCRRDKSPYTPNGFKDASRERSRVSAWWARWPDASIGMPTGQINGYVAVDKDEDTPEALAIWNTLPESRTSKSGRASGVGRHRLFRVPESVEVVKSRNLAGSALRLQGDGAYIILPPSMHPDGNRYEWLDGVGTPVDLPDELLASEKSASGTSRPRSTPRSGSGFHVDGGPIPDGERNNTLASIAGGLRAQGDGVDAIESTLLEVNRTRCSPPLPESEVLKVARSIASRYPAGTAARADARTLAALDEIQRGMWSEPWKNKKSQRDIVISLINVGRRVGTLHRGGVEVSIGYRQLANEAAVSLRTVRKAIPDLVDSGWVRKGRRGSGTRSGTLVLLPRGKVPHSNHLGVSKEPTASSVVPIRAPRLRHTAVLPVNIQGRRVDTIVIKRLGKVAGAIIDYLSTHGLSAKRDEIADFLGVSRARELTRKTPDNLRERVDKDGPITKLERRGIVTVDEDNVVALVGDWEQALQTEREVTGEVFQAKYWRKRYAEQQDAYRNRHKVKAHRYSMVDFARRLGRFTSDLHRDVPDPRPDVVVALFDYLKRRPRAARKTASWLAVTLWAEYDLAPKPTVADVQVAQYEIKQAEQANARSRGVEDEITEQRSIGVSAHVQSGVS